MNILERFIVFISGTMTKPTLYGWFHIMWILIFIATIALIFIFRKKINDRVFKIILIVTTVVLILFEVYKQLVFSFNKTTGEWNYAWYAFPFQFCSTPMYVLFTCIFMKNEKVLKSLYAYLATFSFFAGTAVVFYPITVFIDTIGINIQTMVHHGTRILFAVLLYATGRVEFKVMTVVRALPVFLTLATMAMCMNFIRGDYANFNMFFIAPEGTCDIPVLALLHGEVPYVIFLLAYVLGFTLVASVMLCIAYGVKKLYTLICNKIKPQEFVVAQ